MNHPSTERKKMSAEAFAALGAPLLAYIKPVKVDGTFAYAVHAADGRELAVFADRSLAIAAAAQNDLAPVSVH
ncbi:MAG: DUF1150 family protein [Alphaproteobacteria bacterium]|nr:DUF1150 family protein [Alphaproteobacteria bacterium]